MVESWDLNWTPSSFSYFSVVFGSEGMRPGSSSDNSVYLIGLLWGNQWDNRCELTEEFYKEGKGEEKLEDEEGEKFCKEEKTAFVQTQGHKMDHLLSAYQGHLSFQRHYRMQWFTLCVSYFQIINFLDTTWVVVESAFSRIPGSYKNSKCPAGNRKSSKVNENPDSRVRTTWVWLCCFSLDLWPWTNCFVTLSQHWAFLGGDSLSSPGSGGGVGLGTEKLCKIS